ncbi:AAA family ATPase [Thiorhodovibrio frisius]|uniref:Putative ATPase/kinase involved in NAD metabolism n=1 Tax=Thiorhodovibrio frisius TaxID=631362 RepID=H8Z4T2_9GAMM|nr:AAA family ATPase [Thiorhodovibrio frisius]EIC20339.1 putative ATPase/kinase involved in NAD metabolism [Thiorhodovibrio frisius]WPL21077.1 Trifunctional NAD biosynthesis/regulator protein NadR [Thiorhodovibrio frisius]
MSTGLLLGKFAPLHRGHQLLIETALAENDRVLAMIYHAPDVTKVPLPVRAGWIRALYPQVEVIEAWDGPMQVSNAPEIRRQHETYILGQLGERRVDAFYSSEFYGKHVSCALGAIDRRIDPERTRVPISATAIRAAPYQHREFLEPLVYRDLITRVVFLGAPSTGKSTLAAALAARHHTCWMPEYGREYWEAHQRQRRLSPTQLVEIAEGHRQREDRLAEQANRFLFVDTDASTTRHFARYYHGRALPRLDQLVAECAQRYDLIFLCEDDIAYADTWDRSGPANRREMQAQVKTDLALRKLPYLALHGPLEQRMAPVDQELARFVESC